MHIRYTKIETPEELFNELCDFIIEGFDENGQNCTEDNLKCKYDYKNSKKDEIEDLKKIVDVQRKEYDELRKAYMANKHELEIMKDRNEELLKAGKEVSKEGHAVASQSAKLNNIITDKIQADGYKIVNDIKVWVEFVRKCNRLNDNAYKDMLDMIRKTVSCAPDVK